MHLRHSFSRRSRRFGALVVALLAASAPAAAQIERVSLSDGDAQANADSYQAALSDDGNVVGFRSGASNLVADDTNGWSDIFVRDLDAGTTERVSFDADGNQLTSGLSHQPSLSDDGLIVVFTARYQPGRQNSITGLYDRATDSSAFLLPDMGTGGNPTRPSQGRLNARISGNGQFVVFDTKSRLQNLFEPALEPLTPINTVIFDVLIHDVVTDPPPPLERLSLDSLGDEGRGDSIEPSVSDSGRWVAFHSYADDLVANDLNEHEDVFVRDRDFNTTELISANPSGDPGDDDSIQAVISGDGQFVAFRSRATDLVAGDTNQRWDIFVRDRSAGVTERVSVSSVSVEANHHSTDPDISDSGRFVVFRSLASSLVDTDTNDRADVFVHDRFTGETAIVSRPASGESNGMSHEPAISGDGQWIAFESDATNLIANDTNGARDIFRVANPLFDAVNAEEGR